MLAEINLRFALIATVALWLGIDQRGRAQDGLAADEQPAAKANEASRFARLVRVPLPIRGTVDTQVRRVLERILADLPEDPGRPTVVLEFWPPADGKGDSSEFGRALDLARFLASPSTSAIRTVAYVPKTIRGHAVLVALACEQIIMHPDAMLGAAGIDEPSIDPTVRRGYSEIASRRRTIPPAVALGMLDPQLQVQRLVTATGTRYALADEVPGIQDSITVQSIDTVIPAGQVGLIAGDKLRLEYGFVSHLAQDRLELAAALDVPSSDLEIDPSLGGEWLAVRINVDGAITPVLVNRVVRGIEDQVRQDSINFICIAVDSPGGSLDESIRLASFLAELDPSKIRTVAYVAREARADAAIVALSCDQLVMHEDAVLGGDGAPLDPDAVDLGVPAIQDIAQRKSRNWSLPASIVDSNLSVHRYQRIESSVSDYFCEAELNNRDDADKWQQQEEICADGDVLRLTGQEAQELRLARHVVSDFDEFRQRYQLEDSPSLIEPNWANELVAALATPQVAAGLLFIGFFAMIAELSAPGIGVGGFVSAVCFLLFFWSNFLQGTAGWLEVILFVTGLFFIAMEVAVLPGFGIFGVGGAFMVLASLVLASQTFVIPHNAYQFEQLPRSLLTVVGALGGVVVSMFMLRKYLGNSPLVSRVMLSPPTGDAAIALDQRESVVHYEYLMGKQGRTTTRLSPAGKADFDGELVDVVSNGVAVDRGAIVEVVEVAGNRVVVRQQ